MKNKYQGNFNQNMVILVQENAFGNVVWKFAAILFCPDSVNSLWNGDTIDLGQH